MACTQVHLTSSSISTAKMDITRDLNGGLRRCQSNNDLYTRAHMRRSKSDSHLRCCCVIRATTKSSSSLKTSRSVANGIFSFQFSAGSIFPNSLRWLLFDDTEAEMAVVDAEESVREGEVEKRANWVERLMEVRQRWRDISLKDDKGRILGRDEKDEEEEGDREEEGCEVDYGPEDAEDKVSFDGDSFSSYLLRVPWSQTKLFAKLAFLCNMAYVIPELKAEDLEHYYDLYFVTSSIEKKAVASMVKSNPDPDSNRVLESTLSENNVGSEHKRAIHPSVANEIAASAASYIQTHTKGLFSLGSPPSVQKNQDKVKNEACGPREDGGRSPSRVVCKSEVAAYVAATTMTAVVAAEETAKQEAARDLRSLHSSPCEWFACDDPSSCTRCFVIQGSDSLASWQANLFFEPTKFEGTEVLVHRGIYEAAKGIYEQFMPEILKHLETYGDRARLQFTGHSLGGSLSLLVHLMLLKRKVVKPSTLLPVVTFGSPFVFCGGQHILDDLGLDERDVYSVMMHRDIVPRAFSCNYPNHVAQVLKRLNGTFRSHPCLNKNKLLYTPLGQLFILQPDERSSPPHPLLPPGSALYALIDKKHGGAQGVTTALRAFLNSPHPLDTLSDPTAYGSEGTILRDHDSSNYLKAINGVIRQHTKWFTRRSRMQRLHQWWPLLQPTFSNRGNSDNTAIVNKEVATGV